MTSVAGGTAPPTLPRTTARFNRKHCQSLTETAECARIMQMDWKVPLIHPTVVLVSGGVQDWTCQANNRVSLTRNHPYAHRYKNWPKPS